jgi:hypothetical protein
MSFPHNSNFNNSETSWLKNKAVPPTNSPPAAACPAAGHSTEAAASALRTLPRARLRRNSPRRRSEGTAAPRGGTGQLLGSRTGGLPGPGMMRQGSPPGEGPRGRRRLLFGERGSRLVSRGKRERFKFADLAAKFRAISKFESAESTIRSLFKSSKIQSSERKPCSGHTQR